MSKRQNYDDEGLNPLVIFAVISSIFVLVVMVVIVVFIFIGATSATAPADTDGPYDIFARLVPTVTAASDLLPNQLGSFQRGPLTGTLDAGYQATYKSGNLQIDISGSRDISVALAQADVSNVMQADGAAAIVQRNTGADPSYFLTSGKGAIHYVWSHYVWYFNVTANSQDALDAFMKVFKY